jgi:hypothetical protein
MGDFPVTGRIAPRSMPSPKSKETPENKRATVGMLAEDFPREKSRQRQ